MTLASSIQSLWLSNYPVDWRGIYDGVHPKLLRSLPRYPLVSASYVVPFREPLSQDPQPERRRAQSQPQFEFLASGTISIPGSTTTAFMTKMTQVSKYIKAHVVGGVPLCPASVYMEVALEALATLDRPNSTNDMKVFEDLHFDKPLIYSDDLPDAREFDIRTELDSLCPEGFTVTTSSAKHQVHFSGHLNHKPFDMLSENMIRKQAYVKRQMLNFAQDPAASPLETLSSRTIYNAIFPRVVDYSEPFLTLKKLTITSSGLEGYGSFQLSPAALDGQFVCPPAFVDTLLHAAGFMANASVTADIACICAHVERAVMPSDGPEIYKQEMKVYCSLLDVGHSIVADAYALDGNGKVAGFVEGMSFKKLQLKSFKIHLSRLARPSAPAPIRPTVSTTIPAAKEPRAIAYTREPPAKQPENVETIVRSVLGEVCGIDGGYATGSLMEMGMDSLLIIELAQSIQGRFPNAEVSKSDLENCSTVEELIVTVSHGFKQGSSSESSLPGLTQDNSPISITPGTATPPALSLPPSVAAETIPELEALFNETCGLSLTDDEKGHPLMNLGVDSLLSIELAHELRGRFGLSLDEEHESISSLTFRQLEDLYKKRLSSRLNVAPDDGNQHQKQNGITQIPEKTAANGTFPQTFQRQQNGSPRADLCLFHDGSGLCSMYSRLRDINRTVHGVFSLDAASPDPAIRRMEDLAASYIESGDLGSKGKMILGGELPILSRSAMRKPTIC